MTELAKFQTAQLNLAKIIRTGKGKIDNVEARRLKVYQDLFFNNVEGFCSSSFPVFKSLLAEQEWRKLVYDFFVEHQCETPHFIEISQEFLGYIAEHKQQELPYDFMLELLHYEWVELASSVAHCDVHENEGFSDFAAHQFILPESTFPLLYQYPVHLISADNADDIEAQQTALLVYRDEDFEVQFVLTDVLSVMAMQLVQQNPEINAEQLVQALLEAAPQLSENDITQHLTQACQHFAELGALRLI